jgi:hypothetical protein
MNVALELGCDYYDGSMCGRYTLTADMKKVADRFGAPVPEGFGEGRSERGEGRERTAESFSQNDRNTTEILRLRSG